MGLDMFLNKKRYIWGEEREKLKIEGIDGINPKNVCCIEEEAIYWRKANAIHKWFVDNVQEGKDDCESYYVDRKKLEKLLDLVKKVLADRTLAKKLLPVQEGFFFGSTKYGERYFEDLEPTRTALEKILKKKEDRFEYYYRSSW